MANGVEQFEAFQHPDFSDVTADPTIATDMLQTAALIEAEDHPYGPDVTRLILEERRVPVVIETDESLRPKVIDACGMTCTFCHNEGVPVEADNRSRSQGEFLGSIGMTGRVSVLAETNGVDFLPGKMWPDADKPDEGFLHAIRTLRDTVGLRELHLTGGEPTLHKNLPQLTAAAVDEGFTVKMTSNGETGNRMIPELKRAGLSKVNFSIFGTTPEELADVQAAKYSSPHLAAAKIAALHRAIGSALDNGVDVGANIVMSDSSHASRVQRVMEEFDPSISLRILNDLDRGQESNYAIYSLLASMGAVPRELSLTAGSSNSKVMYDLPDGNDVGFKQIRLTRMEETCADCDMNNPDDCKEGYYGMRLYVDKEGEYRVGVCMQRMDLTMPIDEFADSAVLADILRLRQDEQERLTSFYSDRLSEKGVA